MPDLRRARAILPVLVLALSGLILVKGCGNGEEGETAPAAARDQGLSISFSDVAGAMGYALRNRTGKDGISKNVILEAMPPGVAVGDFDGDGYFDLYCPNGNNIVRYDRKTRTVTLIPPEETPRNELYWNRSGKRFERGAKAAGVDDSLWAFGAIAGDIDNDGDTDIYVCNFGPNRLYLNDGKGKFREAGEIGAAGSPRGWSTGACLFDYDRDGDLDVYVAQYADIYDFLDDEEAVSLGPDGEINARSCTWKGLKVYCGPLGLLPQNDVLLQNQLSETGKLGFKDVTRQMGLYKAPDSLSRTERSLGPYYAFQPVAWDVDDDGWPDVYVSNDSVRSVCWINQKGKGFVDEAGPMSLATSVSNYSPQASMGVALNDLNGDGRFDLSITNFSHDEFNLLIAEKTQSGIVVFNEKAPSTKLRNVTFFKLGWGVNLQDFDNDGDVDIFYACGHVYPEVDRFPAQQTTYAQANVLLLCRDAKRLRFDDVSNRAGPGLKVVKPTRASVAFDFDNDGDLDLATTELNDTPCLLRCDLSGNNHWVMIRLRGRTAANVPLDPVGAEVTVLTEGLSQRRVLLIGSSFQSSEDPRLHFGLGAATAIEAVQVRWPDGLTTEHTDISIDKINTIEYPDR